MARPVNDENRQQVQERILEAARDIFCEKGFIDVTMTDLITAAGMSRGGFYFYYKSVGEVFRAAVRRRQHSKFAEITASIDENPRFFDLLDNYFEMQKTRLLHMETSMLRALYEYLFTHGEKRDDEFRNEQKDNILGTVNAILALGTRQGAIPPGDAKVLAEHIMYTIEGLNVMALLRGLSPETVDRQLSLLTQMLRESGKGQVGYAK